MLVLILLTQTLLAQQRIELNNGKVELVVLKQGGAFPSFRLLDDPKKTNPMWNAGRPGPGTGHFLCVDGFGPVSKDEAAAGMVGHGEANRQDWSVVESNATSVSFRVKLPLAQETLSRRISLAPGEQAALVESTLESEVSFDRPVLWAEHGTIGSPFLALGKVVVDASSTRCQTKPYSGNRGIRTFPSGENFDWPRFGSENLRETPAAHGRMDHIGCLMDPAREHEFITALNTDERIMLGYLFRRADYPWVQHWMNYPANGQYAWGLEFGMQPYDMTRRDILALTPMFGAQTFRWLPGKGKLETRFLMFLTRVPDGFRKTDDVRLEGGRIVIEDKANFKRVELPFSRGL